MKALRVLHIIGGGDTGGAMSHLLPLLPALERAGCDVHLLCLGEGGLAGEARRRGLAAVVLPMRSARDPRVLAPLRRFLAAGPAAGRSAGPGPRMVAAPSARWDVVHTHGMRANLPARLTIPTLRSRPCLFTTVHSDLGLDYESAALSRVYRGIDRVTAGAVDGIICVSASLRDLLESRGYPPEKLLAIHSGLEWQPEPVRGAERAEWAGGLEAPGPAGPRASTDPETRPGPRPSPRPRVGTVARLVQVKDVDLLLEVAGGLRRTHPEVEVLVVGDGPERVRLEDRARDMGLSGTVRFTGRLQEVGPVLGAMDVYVVTSVFEGGVSMSALEAMMSGLPVVTTAAGGVAEAVVDGETGYVVARDQERGPLAAALAERIAALLSDPGLRARMGAAGAQRARERFTIDQTAALTVRAYERCLLARSGRT